jgi:hypothetical protein
MAEYKEGNDSANIEALKREMFRVSFAHGGNEMIPLAATAYAHLLRAQIALRQEANNKKYEQ